ncbi:cytochrome c oxidase subunit 6B, putative [Plasmodium gallinaceum]|uniref:Cytochrome c oxidase subunit 6B, putative n=1 Tax=Plasmodium gallinaceum TaxID=5849 RepID=A0A1J1GW96_PLAGA|nr:cytochrome c oxidase subunit 6B, putative [Plasmodium gallinaceum]CRG96827.1 cytochrome c oxidase subunit 6B, putative [Plasmodium gallinaceum]
MSDLNYLSYKFIKNYDELTSQNPHASDPRFLQINQHNHCVYRYTLFCRCARELGEDDPRCKFQYYRAQIACTAEQLEEWDDHRQKGTCVMDTLPDRLTAHLRQ